MSNESDNVLLSVIVPAFNEAATIDQLLQYVFDLPIDKEIIIVDDGSSDGTREILAAWNKRDRVRVFEHEQNQGKGAAIRTGIVHAIGQYTIIQDADLEYDPKDYTRLMQPIQAREADVVYGSRYMPSQEFGKQPWSSFRLGVSALNVTVRLLYGTNLTDEATCYKLFPTQLLLDMDLVCNRFEFCPEVTAKACRMGLRILEVPVHYSPRSIDEGKKIRWIDGWEALKTLWRWRRWTHTPTSAAGTDLPNEI